MALNQGIVIILFFIETVIIAGLLWLLLKKRSETHKVEKKFRDFVNFLPISLFEADLDGKVTFLNAKAREMLAFSGKSSQKGVYLYDLVHPADRVRCKENIQKVIQGQKSRNEYIALGGGGKEVNIAVYSAVIMENGKPSKIRVNILDITSLNKLEKELAQDRNLLRTVISQIPDPIYVKNLKGQKTLVNAAELEFLGCKDETECLGKTDQELFSAETAARYSALEDRVLQKGKPVFNRQEENGESWFSTTKIPLKDENGKVNGLVAIRHDITGQKWIERALRDSEALFREIADYAPVMIGLNDEIGQFTYFNRTWLEFRGSTLEDELGEGWFQGLHEEDRQQAICKFRDNIQKGEKVDLECRILTAKGEYRWIWITAVPRFTPQKKALTYIFSAVDIHDKVIIERALRESEEKFSKAFHTSPDSIHITRIRDGMIMEASQGMKILFGYDPQEAIGHTTLDLEFYVHPEDRAEILRLFAQDGEINDFEFEFYHHEGETATVRIGSITSRHIELSGEACFLNVIRDITSPKQAEIALREKEERYRSLVETMPDGILLTDLEGKIITCNQHLAEMVGHKDPQQLVDMAALDFVVAEDREKLDQYAELSPNQAPDFPSEFKAVRQDGSNFIGEVKSSIVLDGEGKPAAIVNIIRNITERKKSEEELQRLYRALKVTSSCNQALIRATEEKALFDEIVQLIVDTGGYKMVWIGVLGKEDEFPLLVEASNYNGVSPAPEELIGLENHSLENQSPVFRALLNHTAQIVHDFSKIRTPGPWVSHALANGFAAMISLPLFFGEQVFGCINIFADQNKIFSKEELALLSEMADDVSFGIHTLRMRVEHRLAGELLEISNADLAMAYDATLEGWSHALELRERETAGHSQRVVSLTIALARNLKVDDEEITQIRRGSLLHDIGKMGIPDNILLKPGPLSEDEWVIMRQHPIFAYQLLSSVPYLIHALDIPYSHHEHWDGSGYPRKLKGEDIPLAARIFSVVDVWDALRSDRPYRPAWPEEAVINYIQEQSGKQFDPQVVDAFVNLVARFNGSQ